MSRPGPIGGYQVLAELGRGGMGVVYEVAHPDGGGRRLALKLILPHLADPASLERFRREGQLLARVRHPNVVTVHDLGQDGNGLYLVSEKVEGESLRDRLRRGPLPPGEAARLVAELAVAVQAVHDQGVLHRDLKPHNVIVRPDGSPVLLDFGVALDPSAERLTQTGAALGTPAYASPEQVGGERDHDARTDVYGLGAILFACLSGEAPFEGTGIALIKRVLDDEPRWPDGERAIPRGLEAIARRCLQKDPALRFDSARALAEALNAWRPGAEATPWPRAAAGALLALACLALAVAAFMNSDGAQPAARTPNAPTTDATPVGPAPEQPAASAYREALAAASTGEVVRSLRIEDSRDEVHVAFAGDERLLVLSRKTAVLWDLAREGSIHEWSYKGHVQRASARGDVALLTAGNLLVRLDLAGGEQEEVATFPEPVISLSWSSDARYVAVSSRATLYLLDLQQRDQRPRSIDTHPWWIYATTFSADGAWLAASSGRSMGHAAAVRVYRVPSGEVEFDQKRSCKSNALTFHPTRAELAVGDNLRALSVVRPQGDVLRRYQGTFERKPGDEIAALAHDARIRAACYSPDGARLYSLAGEPNQPGRLACWSADRPEELWTLPALPNPIVSLAVSPDGQALAIGCERGAAIVLRSPQR